MSATLIRVPFYGPVTVEDHILVTFAEQLCIVPSRYGIISDLQDSTTLEGSRYSILATVIAEMLERKMLVTDKMTLHRRCVRLPEGVTAEELYSAYFVSRSLGR